jgi:hypothetical protein
MLKDHYQLFMCIVGYVYNYSMIIPLTFSGQHNDGSRSGQQHPAYTTGFPVHASSAQQQQPPQAEIRIKINLTKYNHARG